jgi:hypothetical protein
MKLTKTFHQKINNQTLLIEFSIEANEEFSELTNKEEIDLDFESIEVISCINEEYHEDVELDDIKEIIEEWVDKNYKKLSREAKSEFE